MTQHLSISIHDFYPFVLYDAYMRASVANSAIHKEKALVHFGTLKDMRGWATCSYRNIDCFSSTQCFMRSAAVSTEN